jgi:hypothetical protein
MTREEILELTLQVVKGKMWWAVTQDTIMEIADAVAKHEREACAQACEEIKWGMWEEYTKHRETRFQDACDGAEVCENAIRARGKV